MAFMWGNNTVIMIVPARLLVSAKHPTLAAGPIAPILASATCVDGSWPNCCCCGCCCCCLVVIVLVVDDRCGCGCYCTVWAVNIDPLGRNNNRPLLLLLSLPPAHQCPSPRRRSTTNRHHDNLRLVVFVAQQQQQLKRAKNRRRPAVRHSRALRMVGHRHNVDDVGGAGCCRQQSSWKIACWSS
jgi:hypothetical protein